MIDPVGKLRPTGGERTGPLRRSPARPPLDPERQAVRDEAARLYAGQALRWGLVCEVVTWADCGDEITALRARVYREKLPHMIAGGAPSDELDARAHHFVARRDGEIVAAMRLVPLPFEAEAIFPDLRKHLRPGTQYVEIGRMVVAPGTGEVGASRLLSLFGLVWGLTHTDYDGLVAYARERTVNHFRMLGLEVVDRLEGVEGKAAQPYVLMIAHRENTLRHLNALGL